MKNSVVLKVYPMGMIIPGRANSKLLWVIELCIHLPGIFVRDRYIVKNSIEKTGGTYDAKIY